MQWFWEALRDMRPARRAELLQWTTGHARVPVRAEAGRGDAAATTWIRLAAAAAAPLRDRDRS